MRDLKRGIKTEDSFQRMMERIIKYIIKHRETSIWVGVGIIGVIVALVYLLSSGEAHKPEADLLSTQGISMLSMGRVKDAEDILLSLTQKYSNTRPGKIALYYLGVINYHTGRFSEALDYFDKFLSKEKNDYLLTSSAQLGAGCSAEGLKDYQRALKYYESITKSKDSPFYLLGMLALGRIKGINGDTKGAIEILNELLKKNPPPEIANEAKYYIGYFNR
uniref:Tetratricopeptide repeat protein n=1 Tax=candidate division WOR-3 bacterium TaxID=2052148 RepID=A0A7C4XDW4_UNCW3